MLNMLNSLVYCIGCVTILFVVVGIALYLSACMSDYRISRKASLAQRNLQRKNPK